MQNNLERPDIEYDPLDNSNFSLHVGADISNLLFTFL